MKKRMICKGDVGKMFKVYADDTFSHFELVCGVDGFIYHYHYHYMKEGPWRSPTACGRGPFGSYYFEEVNALTALILFGNNIPKEFEGWHE